MHSSLILVLLVVTLLGVGVPAMARRRAELGRWRAPHHDVGAPATGAGGASPRRLAPRRVRPADVLPPAGATSLRGTLASRDGALVRRSGGVPTRVLVPRSALPRQRSVRRCGSAGPLLVAASAPAVTLVSGGSPDEVAARRRPLRPLRRLGRRGRAVLGGLRRRAVLLRLGAEVALVVAVLAVVVAPAVAGAAAVLPAWSPVVPLAVLLADLVLLRRRAVRRRAALRRQALAQRAALARAAAERAAAEAARPALPDWSPEDAATAGAPGAAAGGLPPSLTDLRAAAEAERSAGLRPGAATAPAPAAGVAAEAGTQAPAAGLSRRLA